MANRTFTDLKNDADACYQIYASRFAGQPRATRVIAEIDDLIARLTSVVEDSRALLTERKDPAVASLLDSALENLERYTSEKQQIIEAQSDGRVVETARLAARANRVFDVYNRHFAGQGRDTRDFRLLEGMIEELEEIAQMMTPLANGGIPAAGQDLNTVTAQITMYSDEVDHIRNARAQGTPEEKASRLAQLANDQFKIYNGHFAGKGRTTRRPELIERVITNLEDYKAAMQGLAQTGFTSPANNNNIGIVEQNLELYRRELVEVRNARQKVGAQDLAGMLGGAANEIMTAYREEFAGKDRQTRDLDKLSVMCDELRYIQMQMRAIARALDFDFNARNIQVVEEARAMYEAEWKQIRDISGVA